MSDLVTMTREQLDEYTRRVVEETLGDRDAARTAALKEARRRDKAERQAAVLAATVDRRVESVCDLPGAIAKKLLDDLSEAAWARTHSTSRFPPKPAHGNFQGYGENQARQRVESYMQTLREVIEDLA